ncbi:MAG: hypothetical protein ACTSQJ_16080 [Promethearchaeota archaeon]
MIEEDDDEKILEKGITLKSALKNIIIIGIIIIGALLIYMSGNTDSVNSGSFIMTGFMLICMGATLMQIQKQPPEPIRQTLSILKCTNCGLLKVRNFKDGDFVFKKEVEECNQCKNQMEINQIYSVKLKKPTESMKAQKGIKF